MGRTKKHFSKETKTTNAFCANEQRKTFLCNKELTMLINRCWQ